MNNPFGDGVIRFLPSFSVGFTVFWIVGMINSINWIDGLDGLSTGVALIAAVTLGILSLTTQVSQPLIAVLCFALAGALLGFLRWNFHPAKIFSGTTGVQFVGYTLAVLSILGSAKVAVALLVLGVPIIDTFWIIVGRLSQRRSPFTPDRTHIHHRLLDLGLSHRNTVLFIYAICIALGVLSLLVQEVTQAYAFISVFILAGWSCSVPTRGAFDRPEELEAESYDDPARFAEVAEERADGLVSGGTRRGMKAIGQPAAAQRVGPRGAPVNTAFALCRSDRPAGASIGLTMPMDPPVIIAIAVVALFVASTVAQRTGAQR